MAWVMRCETEPKVVKSDIHSPVRSRIRRMFGHASNLVDDPESLMCSMQVNLLYILFSTFFLYLVGLGIFHAQRESSYHTDYFPWKTVIMIAMQPPFCSLLVHNLLKSQLTRIAVRNESCTARHHERPELNYKHYDAPDKQLVRSLFGSTWSYRLPLPEAKRRAARKIRHIRQAFTICSSPIGQALGRCG